MRAYVFTDPALASHAGRFVWLDVDIEKPGNAAFRKQTQINVLPTYLVMNPADQRVALRWVGGATVTQLAGILDDARAAVAAGHATSARKTTDATPADLALARADSLYGRADFAGAAAAYPQAISAAPPGWPSYGRAVESLLFCLDQTEAYEPGARLALDAYQKLKTTSSAANLAATGLDCALSLPDDHPRRQALVDSLDHIAHSVAADLSVPMAADDRSAVFIAMLDARQAAKDSVGAHATAAAWASYLEGEATRATTPEARAVFDAHRLSSYLELGEPERAIPMLTASEHDFPGDYNPPQRLATAYKAMKRWRDALAASDRAMARAYGPRKLLLFRTRADIFVGLADSTAARRTLAEAVHFAESLPTGQRSESSIASLKKALSALQ